MMRYCLISSLFIAALLTTAAAGNTPDEDKIRAAFLYNFSKFIEWPADSFQNTDGALTIGVLGTDRLSDELKPLSGRLVRTHSIIIKYYASVEQVDDCHLLYLGTSDSRDIDKVLTLLSDRPVVVVSDAPDFARNQGIIQLVAVRGRLRFIINQKAALQKNIRINSQLLKLAIEVIEATP